MDEQVKLPLVDVRKLLGAGNGEAALLYLYLRSGGGMEQASAALHIPAARLSASLTLLRQLGLAAPEKPPRYLAPSEPPYVGDDELRAKLSGDADFRLLVGEVQRQLGRVLSTEDLRILGNITGYLGLPTDVVGVLITYCLQRQAEQGRGAPSMRMIEKTAYRWAEDGIDTLEQAAAFLQEQLGRSRTLEQLARKMGLGRSFRPPEEEKLRAWMDLGFGAKEIYYAYERCILSTGALKWPYMDKIIRSWHEQGLHTLARIREKDVRPGAPSAAPPVRGRTDLTSAEAPGELERRMVRRLNGQAEKEGD